jgi:hypothetical protein
MSVTSPDAGPFRTDPPYVADERAMYQGWLDFHRGTLLWKCAGLTDDQLRNASVGPSRLTLLGEYARHNGHADLIRERIDGAIGD